jgi:PKD repeat protein
MFGAMVDDISFAGYTNNGVDDGQMTWSSMVPLGGQLWHIATDAAAPSPTHVMKNQNDNNTYNPNMLNYLVSPSITLPSDGDIRADFMIMGLFTDPGTFPDVDYFGWEISPDNGTTWNAMSNPYANPYGDNYVYSDAPDVWMSMVDSYSLDGFITDFAGQTVKFRWYFKSNGSVDGTGIMIDDFKIISIDHIPSPQISIDPVAIEQSMDVNDFKQVDIVVENYGDAELNWSSTLNSRAITRNPAILTWTLYTDTDQEYVNTKNAILQFVPDATFTETTTTDASELQTLLANHSVFILPEQEQGGEGAFFTNLGISWASVLQSFVSDGGIVIVCGSSYSGEFLDGAGLASVVSSSSWITGGSLELPYPAHPLMQGIVPPVVANDATIGYLLDDPAITSIASLSGYSYIWVKDIGLGAAIHMGYDYFAYDTNAAQFIANSVLYGGNQINYALDPPSGTVLPGSSQICTLTTTTIDCEPGVYLKNIIISSNDMDDPELTLALTTNVSRYLNPDFTYYPESGYAPLSVEFVDASTGTISTWAWDFENDGIIDSNMQNPTHVYDDWGIYSVSLRIEDDLGHNSTLVMEDCIEVLNPYFPIIAVDPVSLSANLAPDTTMDQVLTISNSGTDDLVVSLNVGSTGGRRQSDAINSTRNNNNSNPETKIPSDNLICISDGVYPTFTHDEQKPSRVAVNTNRTDANILILSALDGYDSAFLSGLQSAGIDSYSYYNVNSATPSYDYLSQFDVIIVYSGYGIQDNISLGNMLADCADEGIGIILMQATFCSGGSWQLAGDIMNTGYSPFTIADYSSSYTSCNSFVSHPLTAAVTNIGVGLYSYSSLQGNALALGYYDAGYPVAALNLDKPIIAINTYPYDGDWSGDLIQFVSNSIDWLYADWLNISPSETVIASGASAQINVNFNSTHMANGTYQSNIAISSNDPANPELFVPVSLTVYEDINPPTALVASLATTNSVELSWNAPVDRSVVSYHLWRFPSEYVANEAMWTEIAEVSDVTTYEDFYPYSLDPGDYKWAVKAVYYGGVESSAAISNQLYLAMEFPEIAISTYSLSESLLSGESAEQSFTIYNNGEADLSFDILEISRALQRVIPSAGITSVKIGQMYERKLMDDPDDYPRQKADLSHIRYTNRESNAIESSDTSSTRNLDWLLQTPTTGTILPYGSMEISVSFNSSGLPGGTYWGQLEINSNDMLNPSLLIDVSLTVSVPNFTTDDNEDNAFSGNPDYDLDNYLYNTSSLHPIEFNIFVSETDFSSAQLAILGWDIDETSGEIDHVYLNGNFAGALTGADGEWSTTIIDLNPAWVNPGPNGQNLVQIYVDMNSQGWATEIDWGQIVFSTADADVDIRYVSLDDSLYTTGMDMWITQEIDTNLGSYSILIETNLLNQDGINLEGSSSSFTIHGNQDDAVVISKYLSSGLPYGEYTVQTVVYDASHQILYDIELNPFQIIQPGPLISIDPPSLDLGTVFVTDTLSVAIQVSNSGYYPLDVADLSIANSGFSFSESSLTVPRLESRELIITYNPQIPVEQTLFLTVESNDSVHPDLNYPISMYSPLYPPPVYSDVLPDQIEHQYINHWQVLAEVTFSDSMLVDASTIQYRYDKNGNGSYDALEIWTPVSGFSDAETIHVVQALSWRRDGDHFSYEFRAQNTRQSGWTYTGFQSVEGIADDFYVMIDATPPLWIDQLTVENVGDNSVSLSWSESFDPRFAAYEIYYGTEPYLDDSDFCWDAMDDPMLSDLSTTSTTIYGLNPGTAYYFAIRARDTLDNVSEFSDELSATTTGSSTGIGLGIQVTGTAARLFWDTYPGAALYNVYQADTPQGPWQYIGQTANTEYALELTNNKAFFHIKAESNPAKDSQGEGK